MSYREGWTGLLLERADEIEAEREAENRRKLVVEEMLKEIREEDKKRREEARRKRERARMEAEKQEQIRRRQQVKEAKKILLTYQDLLKESKGLISQIEYSMEAKHFNSCFDNYEAEPEAVRRKALSRIETFKLKIRRAKEAAEVTRLENEQKANTFSAAIAMNMARDNFPSKLEWDRYVRTAVEKMRELLFTPRKDGVWTDSEISEVKNTLQLYRESGAKSFDEMVEWMYNQYDKTRTDYFQKVLDPYGYGWLAKSVK